MTSAFDNKCSALTDHLGKMSRDEVLRFRDILTVRIQTNGVGTPEDEVWLTNMLDNVKGRVVMK